MIWIYCFHSDVDLDTYIWYRQRTSIILKEKNIVGNRFTFVNHYQHQLGTSDLLLQWSSIIKCNQFKSDDTKFYFAHFSDSISPFSGSIVQMVSKQAAVIESYFSCYTLKIGVNEACLYSTTAEYFLSSTVLLSILKHQQCGWHKTGFCYNINTSAVSKGHNNQAGDHLHHLPSQWVLL